MFFLLQGSNRVKIQADTHSHSAMGETHSPCQAGDQARQVGGLKSHWIADTVSTAYDGAGLPPPGRVAAHSTRGVSTSWALFRGASMAEICDVASWSTPHTFARFYRLKVIDPSLPSVGTRVLVVARSRR